LILGSVPEPLIVSIHPFSKVNVIISEDFETGRSGLLSG